MSEKPTVYVQNTVSPVPPSNGLGVAGFVISLIGILLCGGVLCPLGLILSACGLRRQPRGMATAGFVLGLLGTLIPIVVIGIFGFGVVGGCVSMVGIGAAAGTSIQTNKALDLAAVKIHDYGTLHAGALPADADGTAEISGERDGWGRALRYKTLSPGGYELRSAGIDGVFDTSDDVVRSITAGVTTQPEQR